MEVVKKFGGRYPLKTVYVIICALKRYLEFVSEQEEATFWEKKLLGTTSAKSLLNTIYFYNGKVERIICCPIVVVSND